MPPELTIELPDLQAGPAPGGGVRYRCRGGRRTALALVRDVPGRIYYRRFADGVQDARGWAAIDAPADVLRHLADLMVWVASGDLESECERAVARVDATA